MVTGGPIQAPHNLQAAEAVALTIQQRPASQLQLDVPAELDELIRRAIDPDPTARHASAMDLRTELVTFLNRWDRSCNAQSLATYMAETFSGRGAGGSGKPSFAFGEATSHWFSHGDEVRRVEDPAASLETPRRKKPKGGFAAGSTVMAVEESGLGKGRHLRAWALVAGLVGVVAVVVLIVANLGDRPVVKKGEADKTPEEAAQGAYAGPIQVKSQPEQVVIFVDGDMVEPQGDPKRLMGLRAGKRRFKLVAPGYLPWEGDVELVPDEPRVIDHALEDVKVALTVRSKPSKALVFVDGKRIGRAPRTLSDLSAAKTHKVILKARRHEALEFEIAPADWPEDVGAALVVEKTLKKLQKKRKRRRRRRP